MVQRLYNVISIRNNITPIKVTYMYRKGISVNLHPFSASDMGIADSRKRNHPNLMRLRVRHVFLTVKTVLVGRNDRMAQPAQNSPPLSSLSYPHPKINSLVNARPQSPVNTMGLVLLSEQGRPRIKCENHGYNA